MPGAVEDCQGVYDERRRNSGQEEAAAAEKTVVGRPDRSTDVHEVHRFAPRLLRSTGPVDRRGSWLRRSTGPVDRKGSL